MLEVLDPVLAEGLQLGERGGSCPGAGTTTAHTTWARVGARQADHGHVADAGMAGEAVSTSIGATAPELVRMRSRIGPRIVKKSSLSISPISPVWYQPSTTAADVASGSAK